MKAKFLYNPDVTHCYVYSTVHQMVVLGIEPYRQFFQGPQFFLNIFAWFKGHLFFYIANKLRLSH